MLESINLRGGPRSLYRARRSGLESTTYCMLWIEEVFLWCVLYESIRVSYDSYYADWAISIRPVLSSLKTSYLSYPLLSSLLLSSSSPDSH